MSRQKAPFARFNKVSIYVKWKGSRLVYSSKTKWILLELGRTWWYKSNKYSPLLIICFHSAKENLSRPVTPRHITTGTLSAIKITEELLTYCSGTVSNALTNNKILHYKTENFLIRKTTKILIMILLFQRSKEKFSVQRPLIRINFLTEVIAFLFHYIMLYFSLVLYNVSQGLPILGSHWLSACQADELVVLVANCNI